MTGSAGPHRPADAEAAALARRILGGARDAVLSVLDEDGWPMNSRIALQTDAAGVPLALLSAIALHSAALMRDPRAALLLAPPPASRGSILAQPQLSLQVHAEPATLAEAAHLRAAWRTRDPRSALYVDLPDFRFWRLRIRGGLLNAGFGRASLIAPGDL